MIFKNLLLIYQLEHYDKKRFLSFVYRRNWFTLGKRSELDWTKRVGLIFALCTAFIILSSAIVYFLEGFRGLLICLVLYVVLLPVFIVIVDTIIAPLVVAQKKNALLLARRVLLEAKERGLITIGITGSFGKTTVKNILMEVLAEKYQVVTFPGNINTDIGVAQYVLKHKSEIARAGVLIAEMGAYKRGDIKKVCYVVEPDYSITTAIGESHLERFGSLKNIISTKFELANATKKKAFVNNDNSAIESHADAEIADGVDVVKVSAEDEVKNVTPLDDFAGVSFTYRGETFSTRLVADYIVGLSALVFALAGELKLTVVDMKSGLAKVDPVPHRLEVLRNEEEDRVVIDDSYNGNYAGFLAGLEVLGRAKGRKVVVTPGIVELGEERSKEVHEELAKKYAEQIDLLLLVKNKNTEYVVRTLRKVGYNTFKVYDTTKEAHDDLGAVLKNGDTILFQNDITDNYA